MLFGYYPISLWKKGLGWGGWIAQSALVTQIVRTLQRNKCFFDYSCIEGMWNPFPLRETEEGRGYGSSGSKSPDSLLALTGQRVKWRACVSHDWRSINHKTVFLTSSPQKLSQGNFSRCWKMLKDGSATFSKMQTGTVNICVAVNPQYPSCILNPNTAASNTCSETTELLLLC